MVNQRLKELRKINKLTQKQVANDIKMSERHYQDLEYGKVKPSHDTIIILADYFEVSADYLLGRTSIPTPVDDIVNKDLRTEELELISTFRELSIEQQNRVLGFISGMLK